MECVDMPSVLGVLTGPDAKLEYQLYQVDEMSGLWVGIWGGCWQYGMDDAKGGGLLFLDGWILDTIGFNLPGKASIQASVGMGV